MASVSVKTTELIALVEAAKAQHIADCKEQFDKDLAVVKERNANYKGAMRKYRKDVAATADLYKRNIRAATDEDLYNRIVLPQWPRLPDRPWNHPKLEKFVPPNTHYFDSDLALLQAHTRETISVSETSALRRYIRG